MMKRQDKIVAYFFVFLVECFDEVDIFGDRRDNDDVRSDQIFFVKSFAEKLGIKLQSVGDKVSRKRIFFDEFVGLVPVLDDSVVFVHLLQCAHSQVQRLYRVIKSVLDFDRFARIFGDIEQDKIVFFEIVPQKQHGME